MAQKPSILPLGIWYQILSWATETRRSGVSQHGRFSEVANGDTFEANCEGGHVTITRMPNTEEIGMLYRRHAHLQEKKASLPSASNTPFDFDDEADRQRILAMIEGADTERAQLMESEQGIGVLIRSLTEEPEVMEIDVSEMLATGFVAVIACPQKKRPPVLLYPEPLPPVTEKPEPQPEPVPEGEAVLPENFTPLPEEEVPVMETAPVAEVTIPVTEVTESVTEEPESEVVVEGSPDPEEEPA